MSSYRELLAQREALEQQISELKTKERGEKLGEIRELIALYEFTPDELFGKAKHGPKAKAQVAPKYRDPNSGATWSGRGKPPAWIAGQDRERFLIQA